MSAWLFILARDPASAKTRLADALDGTARAKLAMAMLEDVIAASEASSFDRRVVVTESDTVTGLARRHGIESLFAGAVGTNGAGRQALRVASRYGASRAAILAADLPLLTPSDVAELFASTAEVTIAPDRHRRGTNAIVLVPPSVIEPAFGPNSLGIHRQRAREANRSSHLIVTRGLSTDVDTAEDLRHVTKDPNLGPATRTALFDPAVRPEGFEDEPLGITRGR